MSQSRLCEKSAEMGINMKKVLIIGGAGFVGQYLIEYLKQESLFTIAVTKMKNQVLDRCDVSVYDLNILEKDAILELLYQVRPDYIFHLAAQSSVGLSWSQPQLTIDINIKGSINLLEAIREWGENARILLIGSGEEYGFISANEIPIQEESILRPGNIYAATKACQNMLGRIYANAYKMDLIMVRAFNHIGANQSPIFVVSDFCKQVAEIEKGVREPIIKVGNLTACRDFTDVRDVVAAYVLLMKKGVRGETYNVGSGEAVCIQSILDAIRKLSATEISIEVDPKKLRPVDIPIIQADITKLVETTGWKREYSLVDTLKETLDYWRTVV